MRLIAHLYCVFGYLSFCTSAQSSISVPLPSSSIVGRDISADNSTQGTYTSSYPVGVTPTPDPSNRNITLCLLIERSHGDKSAIYDYDRVAAAIQLAVDHVNQHILSGGYQLQTFYKDIGKNCDKKNDIVKYALQILSAGINCNAFLGPGCGYSADSLYNLVEFMRIPMMGCPAAGFAAESDREQYIMATRMSFTHKNTINVIFRFLKHHAYKHVFVVQDESDSFFEELTAVFNREIRKRTDVIRTVTAYPFRSRDATIEQYERMLSTGNQSSRVFVVLSNATVLRTLMVYIAIELFDSPSWGKFTWSFGDESDRLRNLLRWEAKQAYESVLLVALHQVRNDYYETFSTNVKRLARKTLNYTFGAFEEIDPVVTSFYDATLLYSIIMNKIITSGGNIYDGVKVSGMMRNFIFSSPISGDVWIDAVGDRQSDYVVKSFNPATGRFENFCTYTAISDSMVATGPLYWPTKVLPPDVPRCGFQGEFAICHPQGRDKNPMRPFSLQ
ncbi:atrial natriuretic peptide receptor 1-like isoform X2 [Paramacrobiotus metropolitanus]|uniref:atrial natriuretic peptide receptor 1-like isoform X2 n=1 Tax=Paramacrobiotus metropolitanus TaxID=2943436 RepID=UPI002445607C|nr:atrial natriuretic peptide receptor 1-like isoform X2 [Paramacrobiotus metropolitanus]